jgi:hypothetical protein
MSRKSGRDGRTCIHGTYQYQSDMVSATPELCNNKILKLVETSRMHIAKRKKEEKIHAYQKK